jgi:hypothetical protein
VYVEIKRQGTAGSPAVLRAQGLIGDLLAGPFSSDRIVNLKRCNYQAIS